MAGGDARPTIDKGDPAGRPYLWDWGMGCGEGGKGRRPLYQFRIDMQHIIVNNPSKSNQLRGDCHGSTESGD